MTVDRKEANNMIIDTHAHYDDKAFAEDRAELLEAMRSGSVLQGVTSMRDEDNISSPRIHRIVNIGSSLDACKRTIELMGKYDFIYGALGVHPTDSGELTDSDIEWLRKQCMLEKCVAVGEIGLDYYWDEPDREIQKKWFVRQLNLAREVKLPVVIHSRDAAQDTVDIMKAEHAEEVGGVIHCFSYSKEMAKIFLNMGFYIGVGGVVTFSSGRKLKEVVEYLPLEKIVVETDCPYLAPTPFRGKRNDSRKLTYVLDQIAEIKGISREEAEEATARNAFDLYKKLK